MSNVQDVSQSWQNELGISIDEEKWDVICINKIPVCHHARLLQFKVLHGLQISPYRRHKMNPQLSHVSKMQNLDRDLHSLCLGLSKDSSLLDGCFARHGKNIWYGVTYGMLVPALADSMTLFLLQGRTYFCHG